MTQVRAKAKRSPSLEAAAAVHAYVLEEQIGFLLRCAHQRASEMFNAVMGPFGVTPRQFAALAKLDDLGSVSQNQLGRLTAMDPGHHLRGDHPADRPRLCAPVLRPQGWAPGGARSDRGRQPGHHRHEGGCRRGLAANAGSPQRA